MGKVQFPFSSSFVLVLTKFSFWQEDWALGYNSTKFKDLPDKSSESHFISLVVKRKFGRTSISVKIL